MNCPCGNPKEYIDCCEKVHKDLKEAQTAEMLMRARYSAFVVLNIDFLYDTFHPSTRSFQIKRDIEAWAKECKWMQLEILKATVDTVEFKAYYMDMDLNTHVHHERSNFKQFQGSWYFVDGE